MTLKNIKFLMTRQVLNRFFNYFSGSAWATCLVHSDDNLRDSGGARRFPHSIRKFRSNYCLANEILISLVTQQPETKGQGLKDHVEDDAKLADDNADVELTKK